MNPSQAVTRAERVAIMVVCGNQTEEEAQRHCDRYPELFGIRQQVERQEDLFALSCS